MTPANTFDSQKIRDVLVQKLSGDTELKTPGGADFEVERVEQARLILRVGKIRFPLYLRLSCLDELAKECNRLPPNQWMRIGAIHGTPDSSTLDSIVQKYTGGTSAASYLASILEYIEVAEINRKRPQRIRLLPTNF